MIYQSSPLAIGIFIAFVVFVLGLSIWLGRKAKSASGYYAAHGQIGWFVNGVAFAGDYLSAASFLGICGMIAFSGYDGFLYSIGYLAGWVVALFVIAEPIKRLGKFTFADAIDSKFQSRGIKLAVAISTLVVSTFYLIPQMVGAGALIQPLLGLPHYAGVLLVGVTVTLIVATAGMVSTTWVQFIKGSLLVLFCTVLTVMILNRGLTTEKQNEREMGFEQIELDYNPRLPENDSLKFISPDGGWKENIIGEAGGEFPKYLRYGGGKDVIQVFKFAGAAKAWTYYRKCQVITIKPDGTKLVGGLPQSAQNDLKPVGSIYRLGKAGDEERKSTGPLGPLAFLKELQDSEIVTWKSETIPEADGGKSIVYFPELRDGSDLLTPGASSTFKGVRSPNLIDKLDFLSLMLALFCGTASLPHILIRYYTVKDQAAARKSTVVGIAAIGFFYVLTLYLGLGAMTSGTLDPTDSNMAAPLLAKSFSEPLFAVISAIAFTTVLGTVSGLIMAGSGAVAHDILENVLKIPMTDVQKVLFGKLAAVVLGVIAMILGILFQKMNVTFLVGWAFNIAASANLPALVMLLFWKGTTKQGIIAAVTVGMLSSLGWILVSADTMEKVYGLSRDSALVPFSQPGLVTIPLGFVVLVLVSLMTKKKAAV